MYSSVGERHPMPYLSLKPICVRMKSLCVVVPKKKAEPVRQRLMSKGILRKELQIRSDSQNVYFPVTQRVDLCYPVETKNFSEIKEQIKDYRVLVDLPDDLREYLPSSYDVLGSIAIVKVSDEVLPHASKIGKAIIAAQKAVSTVCVDVGVMDEFRTRGVKVVAGEKNLETVHKEYGLVFKMDISKVFFSPRLATERETVANQVGPGETVVDMFAGVGPFSIMIAKTRAPRIIYAIDSNPEAIRYLEENIELNKVKTVKPVLGDARESIVDLEASDRIIMNLPHSANDFLLDAIRALKPGGTIHFYKIMEEVELEDRMNEMRSLAVEEGRVMKLLARRKVKSYSPSLNFYAFDLSFL